MCHALTQGRIITIKFHQVQKVLMLLNLSQKIQEAVSNVEVTVTK